MNEFELQAWERELEAWRRRLKPRAGGEAIGLALAHLSCAVELARSSGDPGHRALLERGFAELRERYDRLLLDTERITIPA